MPQSWPRPPCPRSQRPTAVQVGVNDGAAEDEQLLADLTAGYRLFAHNRGFVAVSDGPAFASQLTCYVAGVGLRVDSRPGQGSCG